MNIDGYFQSKIVPGLWKHKTCQNQFVLVVDDFGVKYISKQDLDHLIDTLCKNYDVTVKLNGKEYIKIELGWDFKNSKVHLSMNPYLEKAHRQFDNFVPTKKQDSPFPHFSPKCGQAKQFSEYDNSPLVRTEEQK